MPIGEAGRAAGRPSSRLPHDCPHACLVRAWRRQGASCDGPTSCGCPPAVIPPPEAPECVPIAVDPGIKVDPGYAPYDEGIKEDVFMRGVDGKPYLGWVSALGRWRGGPATGDGFIRQGVDCACQGCQGM